MSFGFGLGFPRNRPFAGGPSLDFQFAGSTTLDPQITFTRASTATFFDSAGVLQSAAIDVPRLDYDPATLAARGLLIEEQRTNGIRNNTMQGAAAGTPGTLPTNWTQSALASGLTANVTSVGTSNGINYVDIRISGTTADTLGWSVFTDANTQIAASSGQVWSGSSYVAIVGGSTANITLGLCRVVERNSGGGYTSESNVSWAGATSVLSNNRFSVTRTLGATAAFVQFGVYFQANSGVAIDITLRIGLPQLELGAFATSVIPTTTTALTRSADVASVNTLSPWFNASEGTLYAEATWFGLTTNDYYMSFNDGTGSNLISLGIASSSLFRFIVNASGSTEASITSGSPTVNIPFKHAGAYKLNDCAATANGAAPTTDTTVNLPTGINDLRLSGSHGTTNQLNGHIRTIAYYPRRLSNAELVSLTS